MNEQQERDKVMIELRDKILTNPTTKKKYKLKAIGHARPVIVPGGIFDYARKI